VRILFALDKYSAREGGADRFARAAVRALLAAGHTVHVVEAGGEEPPAADRFTRALHPLPQPLWLRDSDCNTLRWNVYWSEVVEEETRAFRPDLLLTQNVLAPASVAAARRAKIPSVIFLHGYRCMSPTLFYGEDALTCAPPSFRTVPLRYKLKWPLTRKVLELYRAAYVAADIVVANSDYSARMVERFFERGAPVVYPVMDLAPVPDAPAPAAEGPVLYVKPQSVKGVDVLLHVARALPARRFVVAGEASARTARALARLPNVDLRGWVEDMPALYREVSLLLGPSQNPEPFGRIFVEAGLRGIPSVSRNLGGGAEAVGPGGILVEPDASMERWVAALQEALVPARHADLSARARAHAEALVRAHDGAALLRALQL